jgi:hypothetical protein
MLISWVYSTIKLNRWLYIIGKYLRSSDDFAFFGQHLISLHTMLRLLFSISLNIDIRLQSLPIASNTVISYIFFLFFSPNISHTNFIILYSTILLFLFIIIFFCINNLRFRFSIMINWDSFIR